MLVQGYRRGKPFSLEVFQVDEEGHTLTPAAGKAFSEMRQAAKASGLLLKINTAFRDNDYQVRLYNKYTARKKLWESKGKKGYPPTPAAAPGYSMHQQGLAVDISLIDREVLHWLEEHADEFSFYRTVSSEPWHWEYIEKVQNG